MLLGSNLVAPEPGETIDYNMIAPEPREAMGYNLTTPAADYCTVR